MLVLEIIAGWVVLSCVAAPAVGKFVFTDVAERDDNLLEGTPSLAPAPIR